MNSLRSIFNALAAGATLILAAACDRTPEGVIPPSDMASLMADIHVGESVVETERRAFASDSMRQVLKQSILARHGYDVATFDSSLMYYGKNMDRYAELYDQVIEIIQKRIDKAEEDIATAGSSAGADPGAGYDMAIDGDSVNVWNLPSSIIFSQASPALNIPFGLNNDRFWDRGDVYTLHGKLSGSGSDGLDLLLAVEYMDGGVDYINVKAMGDGWKRVRLMTDSARVARYVYGTVTYQPDFRRRRTPASLDSISLIRSRYAPGAFYDPRQKSVGRRHSMP